jgi:predicted transcriptional regulator
MKDALAFFDKVLADPDAYPDAFVALPRDPELIRQVLSPGRNRILDYLDEHGPTGSLQALADGIGRDKATVSRDLVLLVEVGLVEATREGRRKRLRATGRPILIA